MASTSPKITKRRFGYFVWGAAISAIVIPELLAAWSKISLPFTTISTMTGHLEFLNPIVEVPVTAAIVFTLVSILRTPPQHPHRTGGGRLTVRATDDSTKPPAAFGDEPARRWFVFAAGCRSWRSGSGR